MSKDRETWISETAAKTFSSGKGDKGNPYIPYRYDGRKEQDAPSLDECLSSAGNILLLSPYGEGSISFVFNGEVFTLSKTSQSEQ